MNWIVVFDTVSAAACVLALLLVTRIPDRVLDRQSRLFLGVAIAIYAFNGVSNVLEHGGITDYLDRFEDYLEILFIPNFLFFLFSAVAGAEQAGRRRAEESLRNSERRFRELGELLPAIVFETDLAGRLTFLNRQGLERTGRTGEEGRSALRASDLLTPEHRSLLEGSAGSDARGRECRGLRKDGTTFPAMAFTAPIVRDGTTRGLRGIIVDVSHAKDLEMQLAQAQKMEAVGTLAGGVAHDFNNLIHAISGYLQLVLRGDRLEGDDRRRLERAGTACDRAAELVRGLLTFSRRSEPEFTSVDLNREIAQVLTILDRTIPKMIRIVPDLAADPWPVRGDPVQLEQVLLNLAANARDAISGQGTLRICTANVELSAAHPLVRNGLPAGRYVRLTVEDDGEGMPPGVVEKVFDPFFTTKEVGRGTGLGLAVVYGIVQGHSGRVTCRSEPGEGTTFEIHLPAASRETSDPDRTAPAGGPRGHGQSVLVVDDDDAVREVARDGLAAAGYRVQTAASGEAALEILEAGEPPSLVILDLGMPGMGGRPCLERIRELYPDLPVLIATGYGEEEAAPLAADGCLSKPFHLEELLAAVAPLVGA